MENLFKTMLEDLRTLEQEEQRRLKAKGLQVGDGQPQRGDASRLRFPAPSGVP
jgi:hypothetical protein